MASSKKPETLSIKMKITYSIIFLGGMVFSYASFMPVGIICASYLIFQKKSRHFRALGIILFILQILVIYIFIDMAIDAQNIYPV
ncbi:MAG: hypothetical protein GF329_12040 [Candidatus Lokiarchaeota archaeon]|nr:hypothetical protein [Candidatus Lokiarchaeota archaeon]